MNVLQLAGDPMAVAKQQINNERIRNEVKHLVKNRTDDFVQNPMKRKLPTIIPQAYVVITDDLTILLLLQLNSSRKSQCMLTLAIRAT